MVQLSSGAIAAIMEGDKRDRPIFQIVACKKMVASNASKPGDRYRLLLSDGIHNCSVMLATQLNPKVTSDYFHPKAVIQVINYTCTSIAPTKKVIVILDAEVVADANAVNNEIIGSPKLYQASNQPGTSTNSNQQMPNKMNSPASKQGFQNGWDGGAQVLDGLSGICVPVVPAPCCRYGCATQEMLKIQQQRLEIERERLEIEKERLAEEKSRRRIEQIQLELSQFVRRNQESSTA